MAGSIERSQALLRELQQMPPARKGRTQPRPDLFDAAMRQTGPKRPTALQRLMAGDFQARLAFLLGVTLVVVLIVTVLT